MTTRAFVNDRLDLLARRAYGTVNAPILRGIIWANPTLSSIEIVEDTEVVTPNIVSVPLSPYEVLNPDDE